MGKLLLMNDVECVVDNDNVVIGHVDSCPTNKGVSEIRAISQFLGTRYPKFTKIIASDSSRLTKLLHHIRMKCSVRHPRIVYSSSLRERNFGVLHGTQYIYGLKSDLFRHSRICAEGGESISQCTDRAVRFVKNQCDNEECILCVSHTFTCQVLSNFICNKKQTFLVDKWFNKGIILVSSFKDGIFEPIIFHDMINLVDYSTQEFYEILL